MPVLPDLAPGTSYGTRPHSSKIINSVWLSGLLFHHPLLPIPHLFFTPTQLLHSFCIRVLTTSASLNMLNLKRWCRYASRQLNLVILPLLGDPIMNLVGRLVRVHGGRVKLEVWCAEINCHVPQHGCWTVKYSHVFLLSDLALVFQLCLSLYINLLLPINLTTGSFQLQCVVLCAYHTPVHCSVAFLQGLLQSAL